MFVVMCFIMSISILSFIIYILLIMIEMCIYIVIYIRLYCVSLLIVVLIFGEDGYVRIINIFVICKYVVFFLFC